MRKIKYAAAALAAVLLCGCTDLTAHESTGIYIPTGTSAGTTTSRPDKGKPDDNGTVVTSSSDTSEDTPPEPQENPSVTILCAGDNLIHNALYNQAAYRAGGNGYDFYPVYEDTRALVEAADLAILNQETIVTDEFEPSTYPCFCSPEALGDTMVDIGFDAMSICNNHVLDRGVKGLAATLNYWKRKHPDTVVYGAYFKDDSDIRLMEVNGITFAFLGYMEHTNGIPFPEGSDCEITYLSEKAKIERDVRRADSIADCVIVSVHYGVEVISEVTDSQLAVTRELVDWGADIIIGTQPHTVQPMEYVEKPGGGQAFVYYCLGNYVSAMSNPLSMVGMLGTLTVTKDLQTGEIIISDAGAVPIITQYEGDHSNIRLYLWEHYTEALGAAHTCAGFSYAYAKDLIERQVKIIDLLD